MTIGDDKPDWRVDGSRDTLLELDALSPDPLSTVPAPVDPALDDELDESIDTGVTEKRMVHPAMHIADRATLTLLSGANAGRIYEVTQASAVLGRSDQADFKIADAAVSRRHARLIRWIGLAFVLEDLGSSNGTYVNGQAVQRATLRSGDRVQLGSSTTMRFAVTDRTEAELQQRLYEGNERDLATNLYSQLHLGRKLRTEVAYARRTETDVAFLLLRFTRWAEIEEQLNGAALQDLLGVIASKLTECGRIEDVVARYDNAVLAILGRAMTRLDAQELATRALRALMSVPLTGGSSLEVCIGATCLSELPLHAGADDLLTTTRRRLDRADPQQRIIVDD